MPGHPEGPSPTRSTGGGDGAGRGVAGAWGPDSLPPSGDLGERGPRQRGRAGPGAPGRPEQARVWGQDTDPEPRAAKARPAATPVLRGRLRQTEPRSHGEAEGGWSSSHRARGGVPESKAPRAAGAHS